MDKGRRKFLINSGLLGAYSTIGLTLSQYFSTSTLGAEESRVRVTPSPHANYLKQASIAMNLSAVSYFQSGRPFIDWSKMSAAMDDEGHTSKCIRFNDQGYPVHIPEGKNVSTILFGFQANADEDGNLDKSNFYVKNGRYVLLYDGDEATWMRGWESKVGENYIKIHGSDVKLISASKGRIVFDLEIKYYYQLNLVIGSVNPENPITNIHIVPIEEEKTFQSKVWDDQFIKIWSGVSCYRFMDLMATNNSTISSWEDRPKLENFTYAREGQVPMELLVDLCNRQNIPGWFNIPIMADDDYVEQFFTLLKNRLNTVALVELSNEVWNWGFQQTRYSAEKFKELNLPSADIGGHVEYYAHRYKQVMKIADSVYGRDRSKRLIRVIAGQAAYDGLNKIILSYEDAYQYADAFATAPYMNLGMGPSEVAERINWSKQDFINYFYEHSLPECISWMRQNKKLADQYNLPLIAYEGGQHMSLGGGAENNEHMVQMLIDVNNDPAMEGLYKEYFDAWKQVGGGLFANFSSTGIWTKWGAWGVLQSAYQPLEESPKYMGTAKWANENGQKFLLKR